MSLFGGIENVLTGGQDQDAQNSEQAGLKDIENVATPTAAQLSIPQLQQYVVAGIMTPAQAIAYMQSSNAYDSIQLDPASMLAEYQALSQLQNVANTGGNDAESQLAMQQALNQSTAALSGEEGSNVLQSEQRGVAPGLAVQAENEADIGNNANALFGADQQAAANAESRQLQALSGVNTVGSNIVGQTSGLAENTAAAQDAINQFNAQNQTAVSEGNANLQQQANAANAQNQQNVSNENTSTANNRTIYNSTTAPQQAYEDTLQKAEGESGAQNSLANEQLSQGKNTLGTSGAVTGLGATTVEGGNSAFGGGSGNVGGFANDLGANGNDVGGTTAGGSPALFTGSGSDSMASMADTAFANGGLVGGLLSMFLSHGGETTDQGPSLDMKKGGVVPGHAPVPGDSPKNDIVPAKVGQKNIRLSPGEIVLPRSIAANPQPDKVQGFLSSLPKYHKMLPKEQQVHPQDVAKVLQALGHMRGGNQNV
jgi:hypothetical protein